MHLVLFIQNTKTNKRKGFTEGIKVITSILLLLMIAALILYITYKYTGSASDTGQKTIDKTGECISSMITGEKCSDT